MDTMLSETLSANPSWTRLGNCLGGRAPMPRQLFGLSGRGFTPRSRGPPTLPIPICKGFFSFLFSSSLVCGRFLSSTARAFRWMHGTSGPGLDSLAQKHLRPLAAFSPCLGSQPDAAPMDFQRIEPIAGQFHDDAPPVTSWRRPRRPTPLFPFANSPT